MSELTRGFYIASFCIDGEPEGLGFWELEKLSGKWLAICDEYLESNGISFDTPWSGNLSHIKTKFTSGSGIALVTFSVNGTPAASVALFSGLSLAAESEVIRVFVDSLGQVGLARIIQTGANKETSGYV
jgi:hypothetical protein